MLKKITYHLDYMTYFATAWIENIVRIFYFNINDFDQIIKVPLVLFGFFCEFFSFWLHFFTDISVPPGNEHVISAFWGHFFSVSRQRFFELFSELNNHPLLTCVCRHVDMSTFCVCRNPRKRRTIENKVSNKKKLNGN